MLLKIIHQIRKSTGYSIDGIRYMFESEFAARIEIFAFILGIGGLIALNVPPLFLLTSFILFMLLLATEALNTAIEVIIDRISPEISDTGKHAKDLGSFAVMCLLFVNIAHLIFALSQAQLTWIKMVF